MSDNCQDAILASKKSDSINDNELSDSCFSKSVCSATDCTGLIPAMPSSEEELEAYEEMYQFVFTGAAKHPDIKSEGLIEAAPIFQQSSLSDKPSP